MNPLVVRAAMDHDVAHRFDVLFYAWLALCGVVALGIDTDGTDGPTEFAGALVDGSTLSSARAAGVDLYEALRDHDVSPALTRTGHAMITGATGTNVNDLKLILIAPHELRV